VSAPAPAAPINLFWSDPLGGSNNDYDLYVTNAAGTTLVAASTNGQSGTQDPAEQIGSAVQCGRQSDTGCKIFRRSSLSAPEHKRRAHDLQHAWARPKVTAPPQLAYGVAATSAIGPYPGGLQTPPNTVETFSSDGPRDFSSMMRQQP
jgi:hypothetical protein